MFSQKHLGVKKEFLIVPERRAQVKHNGYQVVQGPNNLHWSHPETGHEPALRYRTDIKGQQWLLPPAPAQPVAEAATNVTVIERLQKRFKMPKNAEAP